MPGYRALETLRQLNGRRRGTIRHVGKLRPTRATSRRGDTHDHDAVRIPRSRHYRGGNGTSRHADSLGWRMPYQQSPGADNPAHGASGWTRLHGGTRTGTEGIHRPWQVAGRSMPRSGTAAVRQGSLTLSNLSQPLAAAGFSFPLDTHNGPAMAPCLFPVELCSAPPPLSRRGSPARRSRFSA